MNGQFSNDYQKCTLFIAPNGNRVTSGTEVGQRFDLYCFSWDSTYCAGTATNDGSIYGALMSRQPLPPETEISFTPQDWVGTYAMDYDGWKGMLAITGVTPVTGSFTPTGGQKVAISGQVSGRELKLQVDFRSGPANYDLFYHTWGKGIFSGTTGSGSATYGVVGFAT